MYKYANQDLVYKAAAACENYLNEYMEKDAASAAGAMKAVSQKFQNAKKVVKGVGKSIANSDAAAYADWAKKNPKDFAAYMAQAAAGKLKGGVNALQKYKASQKADSTVRNYVPKITDRK